jgi:hypothetical protein
MPKRKTLPKDFDKMLRSASLGELQAVFDHCLIEARGGFSRHTAIGFIECPGALVEWLVGQGLDIDAADDYGATPLWTCAYLGRADRIPRLLSLGADIERVRQSSGTPLHAAAGLQRVEATRVLLAYGADVHAMNRMGQTPLLHALGRTNKADIAAMAQVAKLLLGAGAVVTDEMREALQRVGKDFEVHRESIDPASLAETMSGLAELRRLFGAVPAASRQGSAGIGANALPAGLWPQQHQALWGLMGSSRGGVFGAAPGAMGRSRAGVAPIALPAGTWQQQHQALWNLLVPSRGAAATVQGEVIRITGSVAREILGNRSANWDDAFKVMLADLPVQLGSGNPLPPIDLREAQCLSRALRSGQGDGEQVYRLAELAVAWVASNLMPIPMTEPGHRR